MSIRILIADDHEIVRTSLKALFRRSEFEVVGEACDGNAAVDLVDECSPDVVLLDIVMPGLNGIGTLERIKAAYPALPVLMYSFSEEDHYRQQCEVLGAADYLVKGIPGREMLARLRAAVSAADSSADGQMAGEAERPPDTDRRMG